MTHGVHWLPMVDTVIVMVNGRISEMGSYEDLMSHDGPFAQFLKTYLTMDVGSDINDPECKFTFFDLCQPIMLMFLIGSY